MKKFLLILCLLILATHLAWRAKYPRSDWQQTLTFYITPPDGPVVASNTSRVRWHEGPRLLVDGGSGGSSYDAEALVADLGHGKYLFGLLDRALSFTFAIAVFNDKFDENLNRVEKSRIIVRSRGEVWEVPFDQLPQLITLDDIENLESASFVQPTDLAGSLGNGFNLDRVTFEITNEPTTLGQIDHLRHQWFTIPNRAYYDFEAGPRAKRFRITASDFWIGEASRRFTEN